MPELITYFTSSSWSRLRIKIHLWSLQITIWRWSICYPKFVTDLEFLALFSRGPTLPWFPLYNLVELTDFNRLKTILDCTKYLFRFFTYNSGVFHNETNWKNFLIMRVQKCDFLKWVTNFLGEVPQNYFSLLKKLENRSEFR